jgi:hypothetical protein
MDKWGNHMMDAQFVVAEMAAIGFKLQRDAFTSRMLCGPHLLAPTGSDLSGKYGEERWRGGVVWCWVMMMMIMIVLCLVHGMAPVLCCAVLCCVVLNWF